MRPRLRMPAQLRDEARIEARRVHKPINGRCALIREHNDQVGLFGSTSEGAQTGLRAVGDQDTVDPVGPLHVADIKEAARPLIPTPVRGLRALKLVLGSDGEIQRGRAVGLTRTPTLCPYHTGVHHDTRKHGDSGRLRTIRWTAWETARETAACCSPLSERPVLMELDGELCT